jgi:hypothetical protein
VCPQELWHWHLDLRGSSLEQPEQLKYQRKKLISTPECIALRHRVFSRLRHCDDKTRSAALLLTLEIAGIIKLGRVQLAGQQETRLQFLQGFRVAPNLLISAVKAVTPPVELRGLIKPQQFAPVSCTGDCRGRVSHYSVESRLSRLCSILMEPPTLCAARTLSSATVIRVVSDVQGLRRRRGVMGFRVLSTERPNEGLKTLKLARPYISFPTIEKLGIQRTSCGWGEFPTIRCIVALSGEYVCVSYIGFTCFLILLVRFTL